MSEMEMLQQLTRRKLKTVVLENECIARIYRSGRDADDGGGGSTLPLTLNPCICDTRRKSKRSFALGVCWTHGLPFATPCQPAPGNNHLRNMNVLYVQQSMHSAVEQTASDVRASRLLQIKQELSKMRDCPPESRVSQHHFACGQERNLVG